MYVSGGGTALNTALASATEDIVITDSLFYSPLSWANPLNIMISAAPGQTPSIDSRSSASAIVIQSSAGNVTIVGVSMISGLGHVIQTNAAWQKDLTIDSAPAISTGSASKYGVSIGAGSYAGTIRFTNCVMPAAGQGGLVYGSRCLDLRVENCTISGCVAAPIKLDYWGGWMRRSRLAIASTSGVWGPLSGFIETRQVEGAYPDISNNVIEVGASRLGIVMRDLTAGDQPAVENNTFILGASAVAVYANPATATIDPFTMRNNIFQGGAYAWRASASVTVTHTHNCYDQQTVATHEHTGDPLDATEMILDPCLDPVTYAILAGSPCIDTGTDTGRTPDIIYTERPQGTNYDIGGYEYIFPVDDGTIPSEVWTYVAGRDDFQFLPVSPTAPITSLRDAVLVSILADRRADAYDTLPDPRAADYAGWWGDTYNDEGLGRVGSRLWLLTNTSATSVRLAHDYITEALKWLVDFGLAAKVEVTATAYDMQTIGAQIDVYRQDGEKVTLQFDNLWSVYYGD